MNTIAEQYMNKGEIEQRVMFEKLHNLIVSLYPDAELKISFGILMHKMGKAWVALGYRKDGVSLYTQYPALITEFKAKHPQIKNGKGCINFRLNDAIPLAAVKKIIKGAMDSF